MLDILVSIDNHVALAGLQRDSCNLVLELAGFLRRFRLVLRTDRKRILVFAGQLPLAGNVFCRIAHVVAVEGIGQSILDHGIDHLEIAHLHARAQMRAVWRHGH